jgi:hypothetical protein
MTIATTLGLAGLALFVATTMTWFARANQVAIPDNRLLFLAGWAIAALLGITSLFASSANWLSYVLGGLASLGGVFLLGLYALGKQQAGDAIPERKVSHRPAKYFSCWSMSQSSSTIATTSKSAPVCSWRSSIMPRTLLACRPPPSSANEVICVSFRKQD